jgi:diguanylate cyclase (GGDEF)-like protein
VAGLVWLFGRQLARLDQRNAELDDARRQFDAALSNISQGVSFFNSEQRLVLCNRRFGDIYHMPPALLQPGTTLAQMMDWSYAVGSTTILPRDEFLDRRVMLRHDRAPLHSLVTLADGRIIAIQEQPMPDGGFVATHEDITERRQAEERIAYLARHDALTGLPNRSLLMERISQALDNAGRGAGFAVLFLDLDRFKSVNDTLGHAAGDELLRAVTARLLATARRGDTVARLGGDEFVILQLGLTAQDSPAELAERIIIRLSEPYLVGTTDVMVGVSIGIDVAASDRIAAGDLLKNADMALYAAKQAGRGTWRFFEPEMDARLRSRLALERDLQGAVGRDELELYYQPIVHAGTGTVCGFEALLRWHHPQRGLVGPGEFIAVAEECGAIIAIGEWVLRAACRAAAGWPDHIHVSVNLSPVQFRSANLVAVVRDALAAAGLPGRRLELEVTETVLLQSNAGNVSVMHQLRDLGIGMVMDDFGIGYSSLSYLRRFPFERIKIDQSFVREITTSNDAVCVIRAIVGLCRDLGIRTTAEGVETPDQLKILLAEGCSELQGYLFDRPGPLAGLDRFFTARLITEGPAGRAATPKMASAGA